MKIKKFVKKNKKKLIVVGGLVAGACVAYFLIKDDKSIKTAIKIGELSDAMTEEPYDGYVKTTERLAEMGYDSVADWSGALEIVPDRGYEITLKDLGNLGEAMCELDELDENSKVYALINAEKVKK